jgi:GPH family glycoside/pentoside/hexuronide:cation symporter
MHEATSNVAKNKPIIISETGWPNQGERVGAAIPTASNAAQYFVNVNLWAKQAKVPLFYFSSFDESWKVHHEGDVGARWGIWDKNEKLKH